MTSRAPWLAGLAGLACLVLAASAAPGAGGARPAVVAPGGLVRWAGPGLVSCSIGERSWPPLDGACWYPIDLDRSGSVVLVRRSTGGVASRRVRVGEYPWPTQRLEVEERYVAPPPEAMARIARESAQVARLWQLETPRRFDLPLLPPLDPLPPASRFGARRVFNGQPRHPHTGDDFPAAPGTPVRAVADGRVALAGDQYFAGNAVYVDHGDGLISMSFHLSRIDVHTGESVARGQILGVSGATGRVTGPHLHFGVRWHGARVDPALLLGSSAPVEVH
jgi:murein DD-endopeptidase MepM/ murein hydrolase activator NlpD